MKDWKVCLAGLIAATFLSTGCGSDSSSAAGAGGSGGSAGMGGVGGSGGSIPAPPLGCDPLTPSYCGFPFPNDYWTIEDASTATGLRLALPDVTMPANRSGTRSKPGAFNEMDGFSSGIAAMTHFPGATVSGLASPDTIEESLEADSPTVIINADTGERLAHWAELDEYVVQAKLRIDAGEDKPQFTIGREIEDLLQEQALMLRPAIQPEAGTRYIVAIRNVRDAEGALVAPSQGFLELRDDIPSEDEVIESRRRHFEEIFDVLEDAGVSRDDLQVAWDFTTASRANNTDAMLHIRDDALAKFPEGVSYGIADVEEGIDEALIACRLEITFDVPLYATQCETGALLNLGEDGLPEQNGSCQYAAAMIVPLSAQTNPAWLVEHGHGQLGAKEQVLGRQEIAQASNFAMFGLDHKGFSSDDVPTVVSAILGGDLSTFRAIPERMHQGYLNFLIAMRTLSVEAEKEGSALNQSLATHCGGATIDGSKRYYFGGSQGGILGASIMAINTDIERGLLAVPGQSYNLLLNRSGNFDEYSGQLYGNYGWNALDMQMNLALMQGLWDRAEPTGYSKYIRSNRFPNTPAHEVLIQVSKADHQVTNLGAHVMARSIGGVVNLAETIRDVWGLEVVSGEHVGSAMLEIDFGNPDPPITNIPHWGDTMEDPHGRATELAALGQTLVDFYATGRVSNPCNGPCNEDDLAP